MSVQRFLIIFELIFSISQKSVGRNTDAYKTLLHTGGVFFPPLQTERTSDEVKEISHPDQFVPEFFDAREKWPFCESIRQIMNQGICGFCWAIVTSTVLSDRLCIKSKGKEKFDFSPEDFLGCCHTCVEKKFTNNCKNGGAVVYALEFVAARGVVSGGAHLSNQGCKPISSKTIIDGQSPPCELKCTNPRHALTYNESLKTLSNEFTALPNGTSPFYIKQMQIEILKNGPVIAYINPNEYFHLNYTTEVYSDTRMGDVWHGVRILGWGTEKGVPYWLVANSWGVEWGKLGGFCKLAREVDVMGFAQYAITAPQVIASVNLEAQGSAAVNMEATVFVITANLLIILKIINSNF